MRPSVSFLMDALTLAAWVNVWLILGGCSERTNDPVLRSDSADLAPGTVALVGSEKLSGNFVARVAGRHGLSTMEAGQSVVSEAVLAEAARSKFASTGLLEVCERSAHARALLDRLFERAKAAGPPTDQEINALKAERWMDLDRPSSVSVAHAVVIAKESADAASARAFAERIARATVGISDVSKFIEAANAVATKPLEKRVEQLPHMTADGRAVYLDPFDPRRERPLQFDLAFAAAAHAIAEEGQQSPVVETKFGYHVILMVERVDPQHMSGPEFRRELEPEVFQVRAKRQLDSLLSALRSKATVELARNLEELTEQVSQRP